ncbi:hypothetical protein GQ44DRAFT_717566 [Phaeosphaeriaceae sp. PMI808]|nr:hypothetical protein GQ44DRAFT_717566 [Phaeosphaeriaceae sp. PMI808]
MKSSIAPTRAAHFLFGTLSRTPATRPSGLALRNFFTATQPAANSKLVSFVQRLAPVRRFRNLRFKSDSSSSQRLNPTPYLGSPEPAPSLSQRLKKLSREYGWTAVGVYFALTVIDFPFCFLAVRLLGTDRIGHYEDVIKNAFWTVIRVAFPEAGKKSKDAEIAEATAREGDFGAAELDQRNGAAASIWTQLGLAYLVHKSFIFVRVPLTAAILPKVVKTLRKWGYNVGTKKPKTN